MPVHMTTFIVTAWLLAMVPGAGQALMLRQTLAHGRRAGWLAIAGTCTGLLIWSVAAAGGLSAILLANESAYLALRIVGGLVLAHLGINALRTMGRARANPDLATSVSDPRGAYVSGLATNLGNPKAGVFAISLIPQFVAPNGPVFLAGVLLGAVWALTTATWYAVFILVVARARSLVSRPSTASALHGISGVVLIGLGVGVALGA